MATASLGYIDWYSQSDLDGQTAVTTIAVNILTANGVHHCNAAGNEYHDSNPRHVEHHRAGRRFPGDHLRRGEQFRRHRLLQLRRSDRGRPGQAGDSRTRCQCRGHFILQRHQLHDGRRNGRSQTPLTAAAVGCLVQAKPYWTVDQMREHLFETADYFVANGTYDPLYVRGYGIINAYAAYDTCSEAGVGHARSRPVRMRRRGRDPGQRLRFEHE